MGHDADGVGHTAGFTGTGLTASSRRGVNAGNTCRFCEIIEGNGGAQMVHADDISLAFLDHRPLFPGHMLLVPRMHVATLVELPDDLTAPFFTTVRLLAQAAEEGMAAEGSFVAMNNRVSQSVPHLHVHIVPRRRHDGLKGFFWPRQRYESEAEMIRVADLLRSTIERLKRGKTPR